MNSKLSRLGLSSAILAGALYAIPASANHQLFTPSQICTPESSSTPFFFNSLGQFYNMSTSSSGGLLCGLGQDQAADSNDDIVIQFTDNNDVSGGNVICGATEFSDDYVTISFTSNKEGCATAGGCSVTSSQYVGDNYIVLDNILHGGAYTTSLSCSVPPIRAGSGSYIENVLLYESAGT